jgi:GNAT superfamily N-acetyltransferase
MKFLLDTNIVIPLEPAFVTDLEPSSAPAAELLRLSQEGPRHDLFIHPTLSADILRDRNEARVALRSVLLAKYRQLEQPPPPPFDLVQAFGAPEEGTNDWVDLQNLNAVRADAVDYLVTEDVRIHRRARSVGLGERVLYLSGALTVLRGLLPTPPPAPPAVKLVLVHQLPDGSFWDSLRRDYKGFDAWLQRSKLAHRKGWVVWGVDRQAIAGLCLLKPEEGSEFGMQGKVLKLATFKVSEHHRGFRYGELLMKAAFSSAYNDDFDWMYVTAFEKQAELINMLESFGFEEWPERNANGELILRKTLKASPEDRESLMPLEFHRKYGPRLLKTDGVQTHIIPIQPRYHAILFPEAEEQLTLTSGEHPFGNSIRKAYLCHAQTRQIQPGDVLLFYRSQQGQCVKVVGVAEQTLVSDDVDAIARFVNTRTVYSYAHIQEMATRPVLAILFRQARVLSTPLSLKELQRKGLVRGVPQSIVTAPDEGHSFIRQLLD